MPGTVMDDCCFIVKNVETTTKTGVNSNFSNQNICHVNGKDVKKILPHRGQVL